MTEQERAERERAGLAELAKAGIGPSGDRGNWQSYMEGRAPLSEFAADTALRGRPTFSAGGVGGDADTNNDGVADPGWARNPEPGGRAWMRASERPMGRNPMLPGMNLGSLLGLNQPMPQANPYAMDPRFQTYVNPWAR